MLIAGDKQSLTFVPGRANDYRRGTGHNPKVSFGVGPYFVRRRFERYAGWDHDYPVAHMLDARILKGLARGIGNHTGNGCSSSSRLEAQQDGNYEERKH
jgi:hypothetical protein